MMAAAWTPVAVRKASRPITGVFAGTGTEVAAETESTYPWRELRSSCLMPSRLRFTNNCSIGVFPTRSPIPSAVTVPVDAEGGPGLSQELLNPGHQVPDRLRSRSTTGVAETQSLGPSLDRFGKQDTQVRRRRSYGVLSHVHHVEAFLYGKADCFPGVALNLIEGPLFRGLPDGTATDKYTSLNRHARQLRCLCDGTTVHHHGAGGTVGADVH